MDTNPQTLPPPVNTTLPLRYFAYGLVSLAVFGAALPFLAQDALVQHHYTHHTVALTHLVVLGWITTIILGAAIQLVPVALGVPLHSARLARWTFWCHATGVTGMVASFWIWNFHVLLWFGSLVAAGLSLFIYNMARTLRKMPAHDLVSIHLATALAYLAITFLAGEYLMHDKLGMFSPFGVLGAIHAHAHLAAMGWIVMMMIGVSYRLVPMFTLSKIQNTRRAWMAYLYLNMGIIGIFIGLLLQAAWLPIPVLIAGTGLSFWLWEMLAIVRDRKRPNLDGALKQARVALAHLPPLFLIGLWLSWPRPSLTFWTAQGQTSYGVLAFMGLISLFIVAMLYKIIPFLVWYHVYAPQVGLRPVPKLTDLYSERLRRWAFGVYLAGVWSTAGFSLMGDKLPLAFAQAAAGLMALGIGMTVFNLATPMIHIWRHHDCPLSRWLKGGPSAAMHGPLHAGDVS